MVNRSEHTSDVTPLKPPCAIRKQSNHERDVECLKAKDHSSKACENSSLATELFL